ncbi:MAG: hypothetical protein VKK63_06450, partial [Synechococcus sp.]|nr:hypothetical protein [Synechococcus sp.]
EEQEYVFALGSQLGIEDEQIKAIKQVQFNLWQMRNTPSASDTFNKLIKECASSLLALVFPLLQSLPLALYSV